MKYILDFVLLYSIVKKCSKFKQNVTFIEIQSKLRFIFYSLSNCAIVTLTFFGYPENREELYYEINC